jgi:hypothetical protein
MVIGTDPISRFDAGSADGRRGAAGTAEPIDWNIMTPPPYPPQSIHNFADIPGCDDPQIFGFDPESGLTGLRSQDDWGAITFNFRNTNGFASGAININGNDSPDAQNQGGTPDPVFAAVHDVDAGEDVTVEVGIAYEPIIDIVDPHAVAWEVTFDYGDGTVTTVMVSESTTTDEIDHAYATVGTYEVTITVNNGFADKSDMVQVTVEPIIYDEVVFTDPLSTNPYQQGRNIPVKFTVVEKDQMVTDLNPEVWLRYTVPGESETFIPAQEKNSDNNIAVYSTSAEQYQYSMDTSDIPVGIDIDVVIVLPDFVNVEGTENDHFTTIQIK